MARIHLVLVVLSLVVLSSVSAIRLGNYNVDLNLVNPFSLLTATDATYPAIFNTFNSSLSGLGSVTPIVNQIKADAPDVFSFQGTITAYRSGTPQGVTPVPLPPPAAVPVPGGTVTGTTGTPAPNFIPITNVIYDSNAAFKAALSDYTFFQNIDFEILEFREVTRNYKMRLRVYSGMAIRNSVLPFVIGTPVSNFFATQFTPTVANTFVTFPSYHYGWQRASIFLDGKRWIVTAVSLYPVEATSVGRNQANEVLALTANDEYSLVVGGFNSDSLSLSPNAFNTFLSPTNGYKDVASNSLLPLNAGIGYTNTFPNPAYNLEFDSVIYKTAAAVRTSNYQVVGSWSASSHRPVVVSILPVFPDGAGAAPVAIPLPVPAIPPPPIPKNSESSSPVELVDIPYSKFSDGVEPPTVPGAFEGVFEVTQPNLPAASSSGDAVYLPGAFVNRARPLTHSVSNDAATIQMSLLLIVIAIVAMLSC